MKARFCALLIGCLAANAWAQRPNAEDFDRYGSSEILLLGEVVECRQGPTAMSYPPIYSVRLKVKVGEVLRGQLAVDEALEIGYRQRGGAQPQYEAGEQVVIAASVPHRAGQAMPMHADAVIVPDEAELEAVRKIAALPIGWTHKDGKPLSPWAKIDGYRWPNSKLMQCSVTQHPAIANPNVTMKVEPVIDPAKQIKWTNPDGDGEFRITLTNSADGRVLSGLFQVDGEVQWDQSLLILCQGKAHVLPGTTKPDSSIIVHYLEPGESVSTMVNVLELDGVAWPRGGSRVEFLFAVGSRGSTHSFYYMSRHHDKLRNVAE